MRVGAVAERAARSLVAAPASVAPEAVGSWLADELDGEQQGVGLQGRQAGRALEGVTRQVAADPQSVATFVLGVEQGAVAAEVDEVEEAHVGAQLVGVEAEGGADLGDVEQCLVVAGAALQQVGRQGGEAREAIDLDAPVARRPRAWRRWARPAKRAAPVAAARQERRAGGVAAPRPESRSSAGCKHLRVGRHPEHPAQQRPRLGVRRLVDEAAVVLWRERRRSAPSAPRPTRPGGGDVDARLGRALRPSCHGGPVAEGGEVEAPRGTSKSWGARVACVTRERMRERRKVRSAARRWQRPTRYHSPATSCRP